MHVFWGMKNSCSSNSCNFCYLIGWKGRWSKNRAAQGFYYINSFSSNIFGPYSKTCTCKVRAAWGLVSRGLTVHGFVKKDLKVFRSEIYDLAVFVLTTNFFRGPIFHNLVSDFEFDFIILQICLPQKFCIYYKTF